ncbi:MAG: acetolactate decarboxylase [Desulfobacterales bacterium]|nr:acetolactate decarboxylase [Desulfobacterales bacterium]
MKKYLSVTLVAALVAFSVGCETTKKVQTKKIGTANQVGTAHALMIGAYQGQMTIERLRSYGDLGLGVAENLNGELIILDGKMYQTSVNDELVAPKANSETPFATVVHFNPDKTWPIANPVTYADFEKMLDQQVVNPEIVAAFKITATFDTMRYSTLTLTQNYVPYDQALKNEHVYESDNVKGTLVGFYFPPFFGDVNFKGYTFYFIQDDTRHGGRMIDCKIREGKMEVMYNENVYLISGDIRPPSVSPR